MQENGIVEEWCSSMSARLRRAAQTFNHLTDHSS
jgi:hypothetical protein